MEPLNRILVIAEVGSVHDGSFGNACKLIETAAECGADVVKFQMHISGSESLVDAPSPAYFFAEPRYQYFDRTSFDLKEWSALKKVADSLGIEFLVSPFSNDSVKILEDIGVYAYKIASGEVTNIDMIEVIAATGKPVFVSSGMSNWEELDLAISTLNDCKDLTVMQCSSIYPCPPEKVGLNIISEMKVRYSCKVGFSDHSLGIAAAVSSVMLGVTAIEKHLTFSRSMYGSDAKYSLEPVEFREMVGYIREIEKVLKNPVDKNVITDFEMIREVFQKSIVASMDLPSGTILEKKHIEFKKPGDGILANQFRHVIGKKLLVDLSRDEKLIWGVLE